MFTKKKSKNTIFVIFSISLVDYINKTVLNFPNFL